MAHRSHRLVAVLTLLAAPLAFAQTYVGSGLTFLPELDPSATTSNLQAISSTGVVVGSSYDGSDRPVTMWSNGVPTSLGTLGGSNGVAYGINASGVIVGEADTSDGDVRAFRYANGTMTDLGTFGGYNSHAFGVNSSGVIVGKAQNADDNFQAFSYSEGTLTNLGTLGGANSQARAINSSGVITGYAELNGLTNRAFVYSGGTMTSIGVLSEAYEYASSYAFGINDSGTIVGSSSANANDDRHAFAYAGGIMTDLGTLGGGTFSRANAINNHGAIVGTYTDAANRSYAFYYADNAMIDLGSIFASSLSDGSTTSGFTRLMDAYSINDSGQIVGLGLYFDLATNTSDQRGFVLQVTAIPEPSTYAALAGLGALGLVLYRRRRSALAGTAPHLP